MERKPKAVAFDNRPELDSDIPVLTDFLKDEFYKDLFLSMDYCDFFEPLEFFKLHSEAVQFVLNSCKSGETTAYLEQLTMPNGDPLSYKQCNFLYEHIECWCRDKKAFNHIGNTELRRLHDGLDAFDVLLQHLERLPDHKSKMERLIQERTTWDQNSSNRNDADIPGKSFGEKCKLEIAKYKKLLKLEKSQNGKHVTKDGTNKPAPNNNPKEKRPLNLTIDRAIFLIDAIGGSRLISADKEKLAEVIAFLTGYDQESVRKRYSGLNPENENYKGHTEQGMKTLRADLKILRYYFNMIGLRGEEEKLSEKLGIPMTE